MNKRILGVSVALVSLALISLSSGISTIFAFGNEQFPESRFQSGYGTVSPEGVKNIVKCSTPTFLVRIWNDPQGPLSSVTTEVTLPRYFDSSLNFNATADSYATKQNGEVIHENPIPTNNITWNSNAVGEEFIYQPGTFSYYYGATKYSPVITPVYFTLNGKSLQKITIHYEPILQNNESLQAVWKMNVGGNCISVTKALDTGTKSMYNAGEQVAYIVTLKNNSGDFGYDYQNMRFSDTFDAVNYSNNPADIKIESLDGRTVNGISVVGPTLTFNLSGQLTKNASTQVRITFKLKNALQGNTACNNSGFVLYDSIYGNFVNIRSDFTSTSTLCVNLQTLNPGVKVVKRLVSSSIASLEYVVDVTNTGQSVLNSIKLTDTYDSSRLILSSTTPAFTSNNSGTFVIDNVLHSGAVLNPGQTVSVNVKFDVKSNAPVGLACNLSASINAVDVNNKNVSDQFNVPQDTMNCVNLTVIINKQPYFSITKRLVSNTDTVSGNVVQWEIVVRNICNGDNCDPATFLEFKDSFAAANLTFNSVFAQLKNADGTNVNPNPIQFTPTSITTENGITVIKYTNIVTLVGNITSGQYVVFSVNTTAKDPSNSCVLNTGTATGNTNSVSASACVNIGAVQGVVTKVTLPRTDGLNLVNSILNLPSNIQIAIAIGILGLLLGTLVPSALLVRSKRVE